CAVPLAALSEARGRLDTVCGSSALIVKQVPDSVARRRVLQGADKRIVAQTARYIFQRPQVIAGPILRRDQHDEDVHRLAVQALQGDTRVRHADRADEAVDARVFGVRNGDAPADAGRAELLALEDGLDDLLRLARLEVAGAAEILDHLPDHAFLGGGPQLR